MHIISLLLGPLLLHLLSNSKINQMIRFRKKTKHNEPIKKVATISLNKINIHSHKYKIIQTGLIKSASHNQSNTHQI